MPSVIINERDYTVFNVYGNNNNIVWIPGFAITGPYDAPVALNSVAELKRVFGDTPPSEKYATGATSETTKLCTGWEFACQMLSKGFKVLFQRIAPYVYDGVLTSEINSTLLKSATTTYIAESTSGSETATELKFAIEEKHGGTYGNRLNVIFAINVNGNKLYLKVVDTAIGNTVLEYSEICKIKTNSSNAVDLDCLRKFAKGFVSAVNTSKYIQFKKGVDYSNTVKEFNTYIASKLSDGSTGTFTANANTGEIDYDGSVDSSSWTSTDIFTTTFINPDGVTKSDRCTIKLGDATCTGVDTANTFLGLDYTYNDALEYKIGSDDTTHTILAETIVSKLNSIADKILYDVKFVTLGNISVGGNEIATKNGQNMFSALTEFCATRGDCCAILNPAYGEPQENVSNVFGADFAGNENSSYSAVFAPWCIMTTYSNESRWCSPAMVFLNALAKSVQLGNPVYLPPAGVNRATVTFVSDVEYPIGSAVLANWQNKDKPNNINPIMYLNNYGYVIFGQRTLYDVSDELVGIRSALQELGVRLTVLECKKRIREVAMGLLFEYNNIHTWNEFKSGVSPLFEEMLRNGAIQRYSIVMDDTTMSEDDIDDNTIRGIVKVVPGRAVEDFIISFELYRSGVTFDNEMENN